MQQTAHRQPRGECATAGRRSSAPVLLTFLDQSLSATSRRAGDADGARVGRCGHRPRCGSSHGCRGPWAVAGRLARAIVGRRCARARANLPPYLCASRGFASAVTNFSPLPTVGMQPGLRLVVKAHRSGRWSSVWEIVREDPHPQPLVRRSSGSQSDVAGLRQRLDALTFCPFQ